MSLFDDIRKAAPWAKDLSDEELISKGSEITGMSVRDVARELGVQVDDKRNPTIAGLSAGIDELQGLGWSALAAGADIVGAKGSRDWLERQNKINEIQSQLNGRPDLEQIENQTLGSALPFTNYQIAKQIPNIIGSIGAAIIAPEAAVPAGLARAGALLPRALGGGGMAARVAAAGGEAAAEFGAKRAALEAGKTFGKSIVGGAAFNEGQAIGSLYQAAREGGDENAGLKALALSPAYALSETLPEAMLVGRFAHGSGFSGNMLSRAGKSAGIQSLSGATSEGIQNEMEMALNPTLSDEQKFSNRLNSMAIGGLVEGVMGGVGGAFSRNKAGSILGDANKGDVTLGNTTETSAISTAINGDDSGQLFQNVINPYDVGGHVSAFRAGADTTLNSDQGSLFGGNVQTGTPAATPLPPTVQMAIGQAGNQTVDAKVAQAQQNQEQQDLVKKTAETFGATPVPNARPGSLDIAGKRFYNPIEAQQFLTQLSDFMKVGSDIDHTMAGAAVRSGLVTIDQQKGDIKALIRGIDKVLNTYQIGHVESVQEATAILNDQISKLEGPKALKTAEQINSLYAAMVGAPAPAFTQMQEALTKQEGAKATKPEVKPAKNAPSEVTSVPVDQYLAERGQLNLAPQQTEGVSNGQLQLQQQSNAGVRAVPEQSRAGETSTGTAGNVRPSSVQSVEPTSVGERPLGLQVGAVPGIGVSTSTGTDVTGANTTNASVSSAQEEITAAQTKVRGLIIEAFGTRDADIILDALHNDLSQSEIGKKYGITQQAVSLIVGPKAQATWGPRIELAAKRLGMSRADVEALLAAASPEDNAIVEQELIDDAVKDEEGINTGETFASSETSTSGLAEEAGNEEQTFEGSDLGASAFDERDLGDQKTTNRGYGVINSIGGTQSNTEESQDQTAKWLKAIQDGNIEEANKIAEEMGGRARAVQVESANAGNVRKPTRSRKKVGKGNAKPESTTGETEQAKVETKGEIVTQEQQEVKAWEALPVPISYEQLSPQAKADWAVAVKEGKTNLAAANKVYEENLESIQKQIADDSKTIDGKDLITEVGEEKQRLLLADQTSKLTDAQNERLEKHYGVKRDSEEFFQKLREDVLNYVNKGAEAVAGAIRDIVKQIANGVMAVAVVFNPQFMGQQSAVVFPTNTTEIVQAKVPTAIDSKMSAAGKKAYATLLPTLQKEMKEQNKYFTIVDKPTSTVFVFNPDGTLMESRVVVLGKAMGDFYVGQTDFSKNRITPAGLFKTAAEKGSATYDGKTVYTVGNVAEGWNVVFMHPVYLKEADAQARKDALATGKNTRLSHGCINGPLDFMAKIDNSKMDGSHVFIVPDNQAAVDDFIANKVSNEDLTRVTITPATKTAPGKTTVATSGQTIVGKEEKPVTTGKSKTFANKGIKLFGKPRKINKEQYDLLEGLQYSDVKVSEETGETANLAPIDLADLFKFPSLAMGIKHIHSAGIVNALTAIDNLAIFKNEGNLEDADGIQTSYTDDAGVIRVVIGINQSTLLSKPDADATHTLVHEIGHAVDDPGYGGGVYSVQQEFDEGGIVRRELKNAWSNDSSFEFLDYPFRDFMSGEMSEERFRAELFAQSFAAFLNPDFKAKMEEVAPRTAEFMEDVINDIKSTTFQAGTKEATANEVKRRAQFFATNRGQGLESTQGSKTGQTFLSKGGNPPLKKAREATEKQFNKLPKPIQSPLRHILDNIADFAKKGIPWAAFTEDLADIASKWMPSAKNYVSLTKARDAIKIKYERRIDQILQVYDKLPASVKGVGEHSVNRFLKDSTMSGKWAYAPSWLQNVEIDPIMEARFKAMPKEAQSVIKAVFNHGHESLVEMKRAVTENITTDYDALIAAAQAAGKTKQANNLTAQKRRALADYSRLMANNAGIPYAPLKRFGNYVVIGRSQQFLDELKDAERTGDYTKVEELKKNENHYFVQFAESMGEAKAIKRDEAGNFATVDAFEKDQARNAIYGGQDIQGLFHRLRSMVEDSLDGKTADNATRGINKMLADLHLALLSETSARQSERRRKNISGAENDMMRSFATQGRATAHFIASLENSEGIYDSLKAMKDEAGYDENARRYYNEFMRRHAVNLSYEPTPFIDKAMAGTSAWMLLTSPSYYLQNMTQPFMMSLPVIAGRHGYNKSWSEMTKAYKEIAKVIKHGISEDTYGKLPADVQEVIQKLVDAGRINISLDQDIGRWRSTEESKLAKFGQATEALRKISQDIETLNRVATAIAAYRLEIKQPKATKVSATAYADKIIYTTHGDYSGFNAPRITRHPIGKLATQFRKFQLIQLSLISRLYHDAFVNADPEVRAIGKRALGFTLAHTGVMTGALGLPGVMLLAKLFTKLFGDDDEPEDIELKLRRAIGNDTLADLLLKGAPAALGIDVSNKLGYSQMLSILPYTDVNFDKKGIEAAGFALMTGAAGGLALKAVDGLSLIGQGNYYKGIETLMPRGLSDTMKAGRFMTEGITMRNGDVVMGPDEISVLDAMSVALGLPTSKITDRQFLQNAKYEFDKFYADKDKEIKNAYVKAYKNGDSAGIIDARQAWSDIQQSRQKNGYKMEPLSNLLRAPMEQAKRERNTFGGVEMNKANKGFVQSTSNLLKE